jgi:arginyl-tRNA synthetase
MRNFAKAVDAKTGDITLARKKLGNPKSPRELAEKIVAELEKNKPEFIQSFEVAGPGFINITLASEFFPESVKDVLDQGGNFGKNAHFEGKKVMVEYTDPNPFKQFHIGHLMSNATGESIARILDFSGANVLRSNYQGDVGLHVAKALWAITHTTDGIPDDGTSLSERTKYLGDVYVAGANAFEDDPAAQAEIKQLNKVIFEKTDVKINEIYDKGRAWSLEHFEEIYAKLGTQFNHYFFEGSVAEKGIALVKKFLEKGVFEMSDGAVIFPGDRYGLHTRVFLNSLGLPTYEAKELGLNTTKFEIEPDLAESIIITAHEQKDYFDVVLKAFEFIDTQVAEKTTHMTHGMMRFAEGKMSSRKGNIITGESLIDDMEDMARERIESSGRDTYNNQLPTQVGIAAIKYAILKQDKGKDIIFDPEQSLSFEGDSGPYLQYTYARIQSVLEKAKSEKLEAKSEKNSEEVNTVEKLLYRFPEVIEKSLFDYAPHYVAQYLLELAHAFNSWYGNTKLIDPENPDVEYNLSLAQAVGQVIKNGLWVLGIEAPERM